MKSKVPGALESHNVALHWATAFLHLSGLGKTNSRRGCGSSCQCRPHPASPVTLAELLEKMGLPVPLSLPPAARVLYLGEDVKAGWKMSVLPQFLRKMRLIYLGRKESHLENSWMVRLTQVGF